MDWDRPLPHTLDIQVMATDIDGLGHANNACYVIWCEQCAWSHSRSLGLSVDDYQRLNRAVAIHRASYDYYRPGLEGETLVLGTWLTHCDDKLRLERRFQMLHGETGETVLRGHWRLVGINLATGKPTRLPPEFVEIYGGAVVRDNG